MVVPVAVSALATDSVDGQRGRPSGVMRFDLLKVVGSSPDFLASPDADSPERAASRSIAVQISAWVSIDCRVTSASAARSQTIVFRCRNINGKCPESIIRRALLAGSAAGR